MKSQYFYWVLPLLFLFVVANSCKFRRHESSEGRLARAREQLLRSAVKRPDLTEPVVQVNFKGDLSQGFRVDFDTEDVVLPDSTTLNIRMGAFYFGLLSNESLELIRPSWENLSIEGKMFLAGYYDLVTLGTRAQVWTHTGLSGVLCSCEYFLEKHDRLPRTALELMEYNGINSLVEFEKVPEEDKRAFLLSYVNFHQKRPVRINPNEEGVPGDVYLEPIALSQDDIEQIRAQLEERVTKNGEWDFERAYILTIYDFDRIALRGIWVPGKNIKRELPFLLLEPQPQERTR